MFFSAVCLCAYLSACLSICPYAISLFVLYVRLSLRLSLCLSIYPSVCLSLSPSISVDLSIHLLLVCRRVVMIIISFLYSLHNPLPIYSMPSSETVLTTKSTPLSVITITYSCKLAAPTTRLISSTAPNPLTRTFGSPLCSTRWPVFPKIFPTPILTTWLSTLPSRLSITVCMLTQHWSRIVLIPNVCYRRISSHSLSAQSSSGRISVS